MDTQEENKNGLPKGWVWTRIGDVCFVQGGYAFKSKDYKQQGVPLLRISNITDERVQFQEETVYLNESYLKGFEDFTVSHGDILIALSGATTGKYGIYDLDSLALLNQRVGRLRFFDTLLIVPKFVFNYVEVIKREILREAYGAAQPNISTKDLSEFTLPLPPLPEQHRIVAKIEELFTKLDAGVKALNEIKIQLKRYRQSVLKSAFEGKLTAEWRAFYCHPDPDLSGEGSQPLQYSRDSSVASLPQNDKAVYEPASVLLERINEERKKKLGKKYKELPPIDTTDLPQLPEGVGVGEGGRGLLRTRWVCFQEQRLHRARSSTFAHFKHH